MEEDLDEKIRDPDVWRDFMGDIRFEDVRIKTIGLHSDDEHSVVICIIVVEESLDYLPKLEDLNRVLDFAEKMVRDGYGLR